MAMEESIRERLALKKSEGWEGWIVPVPILMRVITTCIEEGEKHVILAVKSKGNGIRRPEEGKLNILGHTMDKELRDSYLKEYVSNPPPIPEDPPGKIDQFPPW